METPSQNAIFTGDSGAITLMIFIMTVFILCCCLCLNGVNAMDEPLQQPVITPPQHRVVQETIPPVVVSHEELSSTQSLPRYQPSVSDPPSYKTQVSHETVVNFTER